MDSEEVRPSSPPRKRKRRGRPPLTRACTAPVLGSYVRKNFPGDTAGAPPLSLMGKVVSSARGHCTVLYEDGSHEEVQLSEIRNALILVDGHLDEKDPVLSRKRKLDQLISAEGVGPPRTRSMVKSSTAEGVAGQVDTSSSGMQGSNIDYDSDSSSESCGSLPPKDSVLAQELVLPMAPPLPPSSADIGVPEDAVPCLFSVYSFLRSFSHQLFLCPFALDDFVGSLNCTTRNSLLDATHVSLLRALRHHLEIISADGSYIASRCLRLLDWSLFDTVTWPIFVVQYLSVTGYIKQMDLIGIDSCISDGEYYSLPVSSKLTVLQILCDAVVESEEFRAELAMRENMDEEKEYNVTPSLTSPDGGPRRVHPRYSKTSACKHTEVLQHAITKDEPTLNSKLDRIDVKVSDVDQDGNSDECRLCGMDGTLICCDGCPLAYHSRCIGLNKTSLPEGLWFCPECTVKRIGPTSSKVSVGIRGAEVFGMDPFGRVFIRTCNYLLVLNISSNAKSISTYYNQNDVIKVLQVLCSTRETSSLYLDICQAVSQYWEIPLADFWQPGRSDPLPSLTVEKNNAVVVNPLCSSTAEKPLTSLEKAERDNCASDIIVSAVTRVLSFCDNSPNVNIINESLGSVNKIDQSTEKGETPSGEWSSKKVTEAAEEMLVPIMDDQVASGDANAVRKNHSLTCTMSQDHLQNNSIGTLSFELNYSKSGKRSVLEPGVSGLADVAHSDDADLSLSGSHNSRPGNDIPSRGSKGRDADFSCLGLSFKRQAYTNQYIHGELAASAAANLAILSAEESRVSEAQASANPRKAMAANMALQIKAFSGATMHFLWPSSEKKVMDVPRERCGWCIACKTATTSKKGCFLNTAVSNAVKGASRALGSLRPIKSDSSHVPSIAAYILHMEESLRGMIDGYLLDANYNMQWHKSVKEASMCRALKFLLLELERNIRGIAFSGGWFKLVDDWSVELSSAQSSTFFTGPTQKRGPGGRRNRKQPAVSDMVPLTCDDDCNKVQWWRGGRLSKLLFQRGRLPRLLAKRVARQGGSKELFGIYYSNCSETACRTRQIAWRAAVEMSKNASQLALQVRYLDAHLRWRDLVRPEQIPLEGKAVDVEASAFRNAIICDKKVSENRIIYALAFGNQKHLPLRVMKNILETEPSQAEKDKLWFSENYVPLYLIKEYEEKAKGVHLPSLKKVTKTQELQKRQLKATRRDIFLSLLLKGEKPDSCSCASCKEDVFLRDAARCRSCQGYCHRHCLMPAEMKGDAELIMCNPCYRAEAGVSEENQKGILRNHFLIKKDQLVPGAMIKEQIVRSPPIKLAKREALSDMKPLPLVSKNSEQKARCGKRLNYGLIWKRKNDDVSGTDFRLNHIILKDSAGMRTSNGPTCKLCSLPYNPKLMYIRCQNPKCLSWYHADSVQLQEDQIFDLVGFRCYKCRRIQSPMCPYLDPDGKKRWLKRRNNFDKKLASTKQDSRTVPSERVEPVMELTSEAPLQPNAYNPVSESLSELSTGSDATYGTSDGEFSATQAANGVSSVLPVIPTAPVLSAETHLEQDVDVKGFSTIQETNIIDITRSNVKEQQFVSEDVSTEDMEYAPQTYFSFTELLASDDDQFDDLFDMPVDMSEKLCLPSDFDDKQSMGPVEKYGGANESILDGALCQKCSLNQPPPDMRCEICGLTIHSHCSPWEELEIPGNDVWRCGGCREWR